MTGGVNDHMNLEQSAVSCVMFCDAVFPSTIPVASEGFCLSHRIRHRIVTDTKKSGLGKSCQRWAYGRLETVHRWWAKAQRVGRILRDECLHGNPKLQRWGEN